MNVVRLPDAEAVARHAAEAVAAAARDALAQRGAAHVALTGGTSPLRAYELLGPLREDWAGVHFWYGDERCVAFDDPDSNHGAARERLAVPGATFHPMPGPDGPQRGARAYEAELADVVLDLVLLGMGPDGHVASLFPGHPLLDADTRVAGIADSPKPPPERITLTLPAINGARARLLMVGGASKAEALARALGEPDRGTPASLLRRDGLEVAADAAALPSSS